MLNTSAPFFKGGDNFKTEMSKQNAELYSRLFAHAAEDFVTNTDVRNYITVLNTTIKVLQEQLDALFKIVSEHTHFIPPHTHALPIHTHISSNPGNSSSPNVGGYMTMQTPLMTNNPVESAMIRWNTIKFPAIANTTGVIQNKVGSSVKVGPTLMGPLYTTKRRVKEPKDLLTKVSIPPIVKLGR